MEDLSQRQIEILTAIIKEHTDTGEAVGSEILEKKYKLGVSPATIRNEMVVLATKGYLEKAHFSSGRMPSPKGYRFYINNVMKERSLSTVDEVAFKHSIWDERVKEYKMLFQAVRVLAQKTGLLALVTTNSGDLYYAGVCNLLNQNEFQDPLVSGPVLTRLDEVNFWVEILKQSIASKRDILLILGEEDFRDEIFGPCSSIFGEFESQRVSGIIGVIGPKHMRYDHIVPQIRYLSRLIEDIIRLKNEP